MVHLNGILGGSGPEHTNENNEPTHVSWMHASIDIILASLSTLVSGRERAMELSEGLAFAFVENTLPGGVPIAIFEVASLFHGWGQTFKMIFWIIDSSN